jgi:hypothetical protein
MTSETYPLFESALPRDERIFSSQLNLSEAIDALMTFDTHEKAQLSVELAELRRGKLVDTVMLAIHGFATSTGIDAEDEQQRLDIARHFDSHFSQGYNPLRNQVTIYDPSMNTPTELAPVNDESVREFHDLQAQTLRYAVASRIGYEELADL